MMISPAHDDDNLAERLGELDDELIEARAEALRQTLADYDLDEEDADLLSGIHVDDFGNEYLPALPVVAIVGRPNVGKSAAREPHSRPP